jgi:hypothetical protein
MRKMLTVVAVVVACALVPSSAFAWGTAVHRYITRRAIDLLPAALKPFFTHFRDEVVLRSADPDLWRNAGWEDDPNHFIDFGLPELGPFPFKALPREYGAAIEKFGTATLKRIGLLPWREAEEFGNLRRAFEGFARNSSYAPSDVVLFASVAGHYMQDAHQPLHATANYDGQLTGQTGLHSRFETAIFDRFESRLTIDPAPASSLVNPRDAAFDALLASYQLVAPVLDADRAAVAGKDVYDDAYFEALFLAVKPIVERQIAASITQTASLIVGAWEQAGKPVLRTEMPQAIQKVRSPRPQP